jgi:RNA polymerase sigma-70 factor, ECF subfamily
VVDAFLAASRGGDFEALLNLFDPDVVLRADGAVIRIGAAGELVGGRAVATTFSGRAQAARLALVDGLAGAVWAAGGRPRMVFSFAVTDGTITAIEMIADPARLGELTLTVLD